MKFNTLNISSVGLFDSNQSFDFSKSLTTISRDNCSGKSTIVSELRHDFTKLNLKKVEPIPEWLIFFDDNINLPCGGAVWLPLSKLMSSKKWLLQYRAEFEKDLTINIRKFLKEKVETKASKFSGLLSSVQELSASVGKDGKISLLSNKNLEINHCFQAMGECLVLYLSINMAVRKCMKIEAPFVVDSQLVRLDSHLLKSMYPVISKLTKQTIILENSWVWGSLKVIPDIKIIYDRISGYSKVNLPS